MSQLSYYATIPSWILSKKIPNSEKLMCILLSALSQRDGFCFATNSYLGEALGVSEGAIKNILNRLNSIGIITIINKKTKISGNRKIYLQFVETNICSPKLEIDDNGLGDTLVPVSHKKIPSLDTGFDNFYQFYPRKQDKSLALKMFKSKKLYTRIDELIKATKNYAVSVSETDKQFIKLPATFLNNQIWEDYINDVESEKKSNGALNFEDSFTDFVNKLLEINKHIKQLSGEDRRDAFNEQWFEEGSHEDMTIERYGDFRRVMLEIMNSDFKQTLYIHWEATK